MISRRALVAGLGSLALIRRVEAGKPVLLVLTSDASVRSRTITDAFKEKTAITTRISYELGPESDAAAFLADNTRDLKIDGVFAVGDKAFLAAAREYPTTMVVYVDVSDTSPGGGRPTVVGIPNRIDPTVALSRIKGMRPKLERLGMVRSNRDTFADWWDNLKEVCTAQQVELMVQRVNSSSDLPNAFEVLLAASSVVWLQSDPSIWSNSAVARILHDAQLAKIPAVGFDRSQLSAANPAPLVFESSPVGLGEAAAARCLDLLGLSNGNPIRPWPVPWVVGSKVACRLSGVLLNKASAAQVDEWID